MVNRVLPPTIASESYRLSSSGCHQGIVVALQSEFDGLRIIMPEVILEISKAALMEAEKNRNIKEHKKIKAVSLISGSGSYHPFHKP